MYVAPFVYILISIIIWSLLWSDKLSFDTPLDHDIFDYSSCDYSNYYDISRLLCGLNIRSTTTVITVQAATSSLLNIAQSAKKNFVSKT